MALTTLHTNLPALGAQRSLGTNQTALEGSVRRLSSGFRINNAGDDAAGLAVSESLKAQIRGLSQAVRNANDGVSVVNTAEGALNEVSNILIRMRELSVQSASDGISDVERGYLQMEFDQLRDEMNRIATATEFNGRKLLDGSASAVGLDFQIGIRTAAVDRLTVTIPNMSADTMGITSTLGVDTMANSLATMSQIDVAMQTLNGARATLGAFSNRLQSTIESLSVASESLSAANSRIRDTDVAKESAVMASNQVLVQAGVSMLAQANSQPFVLNQLLQS